MEQTTERRWHEVWMEQCEAAETIRLQYGVESAFDYMVGEKLLNFAEAAAEHAEFAQALPQFVSRVRGMFTPEEMATHLPRAECRRREMEEAAADDEGMSIAGERAAAARAAVRPGEGAADRSGARHLVKPAAGRRQDSSDREVLAGLVERVTFHNLENGFCVLRTKARGHRDLVTVVGHAAMVGPGEWITASGEWVNDRTHGQQFKARFMRTSEPSSVEGIEKYLGSGMIRGIGPVYARKLVRAFGEKVFDVIEAEPERLREVTGIGKVRAKRITDAWAEQKVIREIMVFLHSHGVGTARAVRIFTTYGADAVEVMTENPYRLARDIRGIGFVTADAIAMKLGIEKTAMVRVRAGIGYALTEAMDEGHCGLPEEELGPLAAKLLEVPGELIRAALDLELSEGTVVADTVGEIPCIFLGGLHRAERAIAGRLLGIAAGNLPWPDIDPGKALPWVEGKTGLALAPGQADAVRAALSSKVSETPDWSSGIQAIESVFALKRQAHLFRAAPSVTWATFSEPQLTKGFTRFLNDPEPVVRIERVRALLNALGAAELGGEMTQVMVTAEAPTSGNKRIDLLIEWRDSSERPCAAAIEAKLGHHVTSGQLRAYRNHLRKIAKDRRLLVVVAPRLTARTDRSLRRNREWRWTTWRDLLIAYERALPVDFDDAEYLPFRRTLWDQTG